MLGRVLREAGGVAAEGAEALRGEAGGGDLLRGRGEARGADGVLHGRRGEAGAEGAEAAGDEAGREGGGGVVGEGLVEGVGDAVVGGGCLFAVADLFGGRGGGGVVGHGDELRRGWGGGVGRRGDGGWGAWEGGQAVRVDGRRWGRDVVVVDGGALELLDHGADFGVLARRRAGLVEDLALLGGEHAADAVDELGGVLGRPEVDVDGVELVVVLVLVVGVVGGQMPLLVAGDVPHDQGYHADVLVGVAQVDAIEVCHAVISPRPLFRGVRVLQPSKAS